MRCRCTTCFSLQSVLLLTAPGCSFTSAITLMDVSWYSWFYSLSVPLLTLHRKKTIARCSIRHSRLAIRTLRFPIKKIAKNTKRMWFEHEIKQIRQLLTKFMSDVTDVIHYYTHLTSHYVNILIFPASNVTALNPSYRCLSMLRIVWNTCNVHRICK